MTVRWKPLVLLSGVFLIVGLIGVFAIILTLAPRSPEGLLRWARSSREAGRFADAEMIYKQVLQHEPKASGRGDSRGIRRPVSRLGETGTCREDAVHAAS